MATAIYIRVSTDMQEEKGVSLDAQREHLTAYCKFSGLENVKEYLDVGSARTTNRPNFMKMIKDLERGLLKDIVIMRLDRLTRSIVDLNQIMELMNRLGCGLHSAVENVNTKTATGRMIANIIGVLAQWESEMTSERVVEGMDFNASLGIWQGTLPFGYDHDENKRLKINEDEAKILHEAFEMILNGNSFSYTDKYISQKYDLKWKDNFLRRKIRSEHILGNIYRKGKVHENTHEALISKSEQKRLLKRLEENTSARTSSKTHKDLFRRKIQCYQCDNKLALSTAYYTSNSTKYYYKCNNCFKSGNGTISLAETKLEKALLNYFSQIEIDKIDVDHSDTEPSNYEYLIRLEEIEEERDRLQRAWLKKMIDDDYLIKYQKELDAEKTDIEIQLNEHDEPAISERELEKIITTLKVEFEYMEREEKRMFVQRFIKQINFSRQLVEGYKKKYDYIIVNVEFY